MSLPLKRHYGKRARSETTATIEPPGKLPKRQSQSTSQSKQAITPMPRPSPSKVLIVKSSNVTPARISTASTPKSKKAKSPSGTKTKTESSQCSLQQLFLNFSNSPSAASVHCKTCGMSYARGTEPDMSLHEQHHARVTKGIQYRPGSCKEEQILKSYVCRGRGSARMEGCIIVLPPHVRKAQEVIHVMDTELSASPVEAASLVSSKLYLFVSTKQSDDSLKTSCQIVAAVLAGSISEAFDVVPTGSENNPESIITLGEGDGATFASSHPTPAFIGIHRMWCSPTYRRRGLVSMLLDAVADTFIYGRPLQCLQERRNFIAFSQPTQSGSQLARAWLHVNSHDSQPSRWKVYDS